MRFSPLKIIRLVELNLKLKIKKVEGGNKVRGNRVKITNNGRISLGDRVSLNSYPDGELFITALHSHCRMSEISIGNRCILNGTVIHCRNRVVIGDYCLFGPGSKILDNNSHRVTKDIKNRRTAPESKPVIIGKNVWVGMHSTILKGVEIGDNAIVSAHSVVTKNVPSNVVVGGNPAKVIKVLN